ncbi:sensor histidine kinase [Plesiocystis pacifica SIR-1]|uniref:histidine kinase n=1 Tax=Plesiocystis pacifica SIR-1 TaxID=391625 RepID=A6G2A7_9BACT|nr:sensor histidine kinase [Plesiocystis pacifica SIR-1]
MLRASAHARIYEAQRDSDQHRVLAKVFEIEDPASEARVMHEFHLLQGLEIDGVVRPIGVERSGGELVLLLDYVPSQNLAQVAAGRPLAVRRFLPWAMRMAEILGEIHSRRIVHRDIKPSNILVEAGSERIVFADFGLSALAEKMRRGAHDPDVLHGTLPYIAPEQTGRMRGDVDFRSDLYGLGATFYELLTGRRPFSATTPLELIHAHLARRPEPPRRHAPGLPERLSAIVMKLLEKAPEHRYQSALGLLADLERVAAALARGAEPEFELGRDDRPQWLQLPHQLYGREGERAQLAKALERCVDEGSRRVALIRGGLGLGKTALLTSAAQLGGTLAFGSYEREGGPHSGLIQALQAVLEQLLAEPEEVLARWGERLRGALGTLAPVVSALLPELELVIGAPGEPAALPELEPVERKHRLYLALGRLLTGLCAARPLILALDDVHRADEASLELLLALSRDGKGPLLLVASYRSEAEPESASELAGVEGLIAELGAQGRPPLELELRPLDESELERLLVDALGAVSGPLDELLAFVLRRSGGRPLAIRQLLLHLGDMGLLRPSATGWTWDIDALRRASVPGDVLALLGAKLERVDPIQREVLELAACAGERVDPTLLLGELGGPFELDPDALFATLRELVDSGLLYTEAPGFRFTHARLRELVLARMEAGRRRRASWALGRELLARAGGARALTLAAGGGLFRVVDLLDLGARGRPLDAALRGELLELNLEAGDRALGEAAWVRAERYYGFVLDGLEGEGLPRALRFRASFGLAQALYLRAEFDRADSIFEALLATELSLPELSAVTARRVNILTHAGHPRRAVDFGLEALARCGLELPPRLDAEALAARLRAHAGELGLEHLRADAHGSATDPRPSALMTILDSLHNLTLNIDRGLYLFLLDTHVEALLGNGWHRSLGSVLSSLGFAMLGMRDFAEAQRLGELSLALAERDPLEDRGWMIFVGPCFHPFAKVVNAIEGAHRRAIEGGERIEAAYKAGIGLVVMLEAGRHLDELEAAALRFHGIHGDWGTPGVQAITGSVLFLVEALRGRAVEAPAGAAPLPRITGLDNADVAMLIRYGAVSTRAWAAILAGDHARAWELCEQIAGDFEAVMFGNWAVARHGVLDAVASGERAQREGREGDSLRARIEARLELVRAWAERGPANCQAYVDIIQAELATLAGDLAGATRGYEQAYKRAKGLGRTWVEGLACLRLAALADRAQWELVAEGARRRALRVFERWGASALAEGLREQLGLAPERDVSSTQITNYAEGSSLSASVPSARGMNSLDLVAVLDTIRSLGEKLELEEVITEVLASAVAAGGGDRGVLLLEREGELTLVAESRGGETRAFLDRARPFAEAHAELPSSAIYYVQRTGVPLVVHDLLADPRFGADPYVRREGVRSLLCMPIRKQGARVGELVLENRLAPGAFTNDRLETSRLLMAQAAGALDNARLYAELARSEAQWRSLVDGAPDTITLLDEQGIVEFANHEDMAQRGEPGDRGLDPDSAARWRGALAEVLIRSEARELELSQTSPDAPTRWFMTRLAAIHVRGQPRRVLSIARDVTERKAFEAQRRQQQRLESLGTLAAGVAHEINNPVQGILNYAELIRDELDDPDTVDEFAREITMEADRVATIVRQLLLFARRERVHEGAPEARQDQDQGHEREQLREHIEVGALVRSTLLLIRSVMSKDQITLEVDLDEGLPPIPCRPQQIRQVVMNLATNARDALNERYPGADPRKRLRIGSRLIERPEGAWVQIRVEDTAGGIPEHVLARIFDPFFTTKGRRQGTGLGLSVSHGIAREHGGTLRVESQLGEGSCFMLELPVEVEVDADAPESPA